VIAAGATVRAVAKTYKWDKYQSEARREPFVIGDLPPWHSLAGGSLVIQVPDGDAFLEAETAGSTRRSLELMCGDQWPFVAELISGGAADDDGNRPGQPIPMTGLMAFVQDITRHFSLGEDNRPPAVGRR
jgi:hypothetical protein